MQFLTKISDILTGRKADQSNIPAGSGIFYNGGDNFLNIRSITRRNAALRYDSQSAFLAYGTHELVYSCINKLADVMNDANIIVEVKNADGHWEPKEGHLLPTLLKRPNNIESGRDFRRMMVQSEQASGIFYAEIIRSTAGLPVELHPINPVRIVAWPNFQTRQIAFYRYTRPDGRFNDILPENMLIRRRADISNRFFGFSPLEVALKSINSDLGLSDYIDAFFESDGTPSGILKILNASLTPTKREALQADWKRRYGRGGSNQRGVAVLDQNAEFQKIGSNLNELDTDKISDRFESRICSVFGVPPILVGAWVGLRHTTANATAKAALRDFWDNKVSPELAAFREWLTWSVLPEFESLDDIKAEKVRVSYDISHVAFLQEDADGIHTRARENFKAGFWTLNEARTATGMPPDEVAGSDYYVQPLNVVAVTPEIRAMEAEKEPQAAPPPVIAPVPVETPPKVETVHHSEKKTFDLNGLIVGREPRGVETMIDFKRIVDEHESEKQKILAILSKIRTDLIDQSVETLDSLTPETAHTLTLIPDTKKRNDLLKTLQIAYIAGRVQIVDEIAAQHAAIGKSNLPPATKDRDPLKNIDPDDLEYLDELTDGMFSRVINEITTRAVGEYLTLKLLLSYTKDALKKALFGQSEKFLAEISGNTVNAANSKGRDAEIIANADQLDHTEYSAILDANTCEPCGDADGETAIDPLDLPAAPNPDCEGSDRCRCIHIGVII